MVMRYLRKRKTPKHLCLRVKKYLQYVITELADRQIDHTILDQVSMSLRAELLFVTIGTQLKHFPLFRNTSDRAMEKLSLLSEVMVQTSGDIIESDGQLATGFYVVVHGEVLIKNSRARHERRVTDEHFFGQTTIFRSEVRKGYAITMNVSEMVHLTKTAMMKLQRIYPGIRVEVERIAQLLDEDMFHVISITKALWEKEYELERSTVVNYRSSPRGSVTELHPHAGNSAQLLLTGEEPDPSTPEIRSVPTLRSATLRSEEYSKQGSRVSQDSIIP